MVTSNGSLSSMYYGRTFYECTFCVSRLNILFGTYVLFTITWEVLTLSHETVDPYNTLDHQSWSPGPLEFKGVV